MSSIDKKEIKGIVSRHLLKKDSSKKFVGTIYSDLEDLDKVLKFFAEEYKDKADVVVAIDGSGYILGSMVARELNIGFIPAVKEKSDKVYGDEYYRASYINHADQATSLVVRRDCINGSKKVLIVDNWIESGATIQALLAVMEIASLEVVGVATFGIDNNKYTESLKKDVKVTAVIEE